MKGDCRPGERASRRYHTTGRSETALFRGSSAQRNTPSAAKTDAEDLLRRDDSPEGEVIASNQQDRWGAVLMARPERSIMYSESDLLPAEEL